MWLTLLDQRGRNFLIPEDLFLAVYQSGLNSPPEELAPCLNLIQADHYNAATLDTQLEALFAQNGVSLEELATRLKHWKDHGLPPHPGQFRNDRSLMNYFVMRLLSHFIPHVNVKYFVPNYSAYEASNYDIVKKRVGPFELVTWSCIAANLILTASGVASNTDVLTAGTNSLVCYLFTWGSHSGHEALMWSKEGFKVRHSATYCRFVLTHTVFPSRGESAYSVLLDLLSRIKRSEDSKPSISYIPEHAEHHQRTATQRPDYDKIDLWPLDIMDNRRRGESTSESYHRKYDLCSLSGAKALPAILGLVRSMLPFAVQAFLGTISQGRNWADHVVAFGMFIMTFIATMFFVVVVQVGAINDGAFLGEVAKSLVDLINITGPNNTGRAQLFLSTRKDIDAFRSLLQWVVAYDRWNTRYNVFAIEVVLLISLGSLAVLFLITMFDVKLAEWNILLMCDGFGALFISTASLSMFVASHHALTVDVVRALHGQKCAIDEFLMGHAGTTREEEREEMRHAQLMLANLVTLIEDLAPARMFGIIRLNWANVAKISATMGAVFLSMVYDRVREEMG